MMKRKKIILYILSVLVIGAGIAGYFIQKSTTNEPSISTQTVVQMVTPVNHQKDNPPATRKKDRIKPIRKTEPEQTGDPTDETLLSENEPESYTDENTPVERIKKQIYDINVEYIDDIDMLDDIVQDSAAEPLDLWDGQWVSVDDWKRYDDLFTIETDESGTFTLVPEKEGVQSYHYDPEKKEFTWDMDYYGKTISHKAKFISDDVMVLMKISGIKVALDIYTRSQP